MNVRRALGVRGARMEGMSIALKAEIMARAVRCWGEWGEAIEGEVGFVDELLLGEQGIEVDCKYQLGDLALAIRNRNTPIDGLYPKRVSTSRNLPFSIAQIFTG